MRQIKYTCDLCQFESDDPRKFVGLAKPFGADALASLHPRDTEKHLCEQCMDRVAVLSENRKCRKDRAIAP